MKLVSFQVRKFRNIDKLPDKKYDHYKPAETLLRDQANLLPKLSQETLNRFASLFERINSSRV